MCYGPWVGGVVARCAHGSLFLEDSPSFYPVEQLPQNHTQGPNFCTLQPLLAYQECLFFVLILVTGPRLKYFKFIWLYRNREICHGLMHKSLPLHSEGLCPSGRGGDVQKGVYFQCRLHHALSDPESATASSHSPPSGRRNPPLFP